MKEYIDKIDAVTIPVLPKEQRVEYCNKDEAFEAGWKTCQEYIATCIEGDDVISREAAIKLLEAHGLANGNVAGRHSGKCDLAAELLMQIPAADVRPVKRGKWKVAKEGFYYCAKCGYMPDAHPFKFCPECGADMREDDNGV